MSSSTLTFLFTDIEGSTQLWDKHPEAMKLALARHDVILRQAIEAHAGHVFKTVGDAFCAAFPSAQDAVSAALDAQRAIRAESWDETTVIKVRMGLHSGAAEVRDNDYFGATLNRVARLMSAGHGGQTLLSAITRELVHANLPEDVELRDMGERGLKDLIRPEHIYQLTATGLPTDFPPLKTLEAFRTNLPVQLTSFIGREKEISAVKGLMAENRLTTLTGSGGTGKTRLSLQVAADLLDSFPDGVWFVELASLTDLTLFPLAVLTTLGLREEVDRPVLETLIHHLQAKTVLLILDNCEHLVKAAAQFAESVLHTCLNLRLLVSSREALDIPGEKTYHVRSLSIPESHLPQSVETITGYDAVSLFVDRAQTVLPSFRVTNTNATAIAQICSRLDGIPLAIELAAARVKMLKVEQIAERLDDRFNLLTGGSRTALPRQQTLRAMMDWSYDLLPESERILLRRLSVFAGGWTLEAAETVCQGPGIDDYNVLDPLAQLVNKSLVAVDVDESHASVESRYQLLKTVRQYVREKLSETGEGMAVRDLHLQYFLGLAERAEPELVGPHVVEWRKRLETELDNIRAALEWSLKRDAQVGLQLINALAEFWLETGHIDLARGWLPQLLRQPEAQARTKIRVRALINQTSLVQSQSALHEALSIARELEDQSGIALSLLNLGFAEENLAKSRALLMESLSIYRTLRDKVGMVHALSALGDAWEPIQNHQQARAYLNECLALCREIGYISMTALILCQLGQMSLWREDNAAARAWLNESLASQKQLGDDITIESISLLGHLAFREGNYAQACAYYENCISRADQANQYLKHWACTFLGYTALRQSDTVRARALFDQSQQGFTQFADTRGLIYTLEGFASMAVLQRQPKRAVQIFAWADTARQAIENKRPPVEQADVERDLATIRTQIDEATIVAAQEAGRTMSMDEAIAYALETSPDIDGSAQRWEQPATTAKELTGPLIDSKVTAQVSNESRKRIFISYKHDTQPDGSLAFFLHQAIGQQHDVFIDQMMPVGTVWSERIQQELESCDFLIPLLSAQSAQSEMVEKEISTAHRLGRSRAGQPGILPVRLAYTDPFEYPLSAYLNPLNWAAWSSEADTAHLVDELLTAIAGGQLSLTNPQQKQALLQAPAVTTLARPTASADIGQLERPDGTLDIESRFYLERPADAACQRELARGGTTIVIKAPRQMGKSSLLVRAAAQARRSGRAVAFLDFQLLDEDILTDPQRFFQVFCRWIADELDLDDTVDEIWQGGLGHTQSCTKYIRRQALKKLETPLTLVMDEVDRMLLCPFRSDFFGMLRSWHNSRATSPEWRKLDLILVISTEPYLLIDDLKQSPFNVGEVLRLDDFTQQQIADLNDRHGQPFNLRQVENLRKLLGGHPYLVRQALYRTAVGEYTPESLFAHASDENGPFGDHLRRHLARFNEHPALAQAMLTIIRRQSCPDELLYERLHSVGLAVRVDERILPRCELYADYFWERLSHV